MRLQPRLGTLEVRIADAQTTIGEVAALAALIQALVRLEATEPLARDELLDAPEVLAENRFLASRDGMAARLIDPVEEMRVPVERSLDELLARARPHARDLDCVAELAVVGELARRPGAERQRAIASKRGLPAIGRGAQLALSRGSGRAGRGVAPAAPLGASDDVARR